MDDAIKHLEEVLGPHDDWDVSARAQAAALMREEARCAWDAEYQQDRARQALRMLRTRRPHSSRELDDDPRALLTQARLQAVLGDNKAALDSCNKSLKLDPTPSGWRLKLRLLDVSGGDHDWSEDTDLAELNAAPVSPELREAILEFRSAVSEYNLRDRSYGAIELRITERESRAEGSLERHIAAQLSRNQIDYHGLTKDKKLDRLSSAFQVPGHVGVLKAVPAAVHLTRDVTRYIKSISRRFARALPSM